MFLILERRTADQIYDYIVRNYSNARSLYYGSGRILWATNVSESEGNFKYSYLAVPVVNWNSSFVNSNYYGQNDDQQSIRLKVTVWPTRRNPPSSSTTRLLSDAPS